VSLGQLQHFASDLRRAIALAPQSSPKISLRRAIHSSPEHKCFSCIRKRSAAPLQLSSVHHRIAIALLLFSNEKDCNCSISQTDQSFKMTNITQLANESLHVRTNNGIVLSPHDLEL
jgi:hypothetical protein